MLQNLREEVVAGLRSWNDAADSAESPLLNLRYTQQKLKEKDATVPSLRRLAVNQLLWDSIEQLKATHATYAQLLLLRFADAKKMRRVGLEMKLSANQVKHMQAHAIDALTRLIAERETRLGEQQVTQLIDSLPTTNYAHFIGSATANELFCQIDAAPTRQWAIVGIGGVGKTALAHLLARRLLRTHRYAAVAWLHITQTLQPLSWERLIHQLWQQLTGGSETTLSADAQFAQVRHQLREQCWLVVIDNLETQAEIDLVANTLQPLTDPSSVLVTSRVRPQSSAGLTVYPVQTLSREASFELLRTVGAEVGSADFAAATDQQLTPIYDKTGGNPLALRLVVGLASVLPLPEILRDLVTARSSSIADFYNYIYRRSWSLLQPDERQLLEMMPIADERTGMPIDQMEAVSGLATDRLWAAIHGLVNRSLLVPSSDMWQRTYTIHRLTQSFLQTEIIKLDD